MSRPYYRELQPGLLLEYAPGSFIAQCAAGTCHAHVLPTGTQAAQAIAHMQQIGWQVDGLRWYCPAHVLVDCSDSGDVRRVQRGTA